MKPRCWHEYGTGFFPRVRDLRKVTCPECRRRLIDYGTIDGRRVVAADIGPKPEPSREAGAVGP